MFINTLPACMVQKFRKNVIESLFNIANDKVLILNINKTNVETTQFGTKRDG